LVLLDETVSALVVDDDRHFAETMGQVIQNQGVRVAIVETAEEALPIHGNHDVIFADLQLPEMSGIELAKRIYADHPGKWFIPISGKKGYPERFQRAELHYELMLRKPLNTEQFDQLANQLGQWKFQKERYISLLNRIAGDLARSRSVDPGTRLDSFRAFSGAKELVRSVLDTAVRHRGPRRRQCALMLRMALNRLSLVPSSTFHFRVPTPDDYAALDEIVLVLGARHISNNDLWSLDERLESLGVHLGPELEDLDVFDSD
jgi:CheY-like chemotaxis protein